MRAASESRAPACINLRSTDTRGSLDQHNYSDGQVISGDPLRYDLRCPGWNASATECLAFRGGRGSVAHEQVSRRSWRMDRCVFFAPSQPVIDVSPSISPARTCESARSIPAYPIPTALFLEAPCVHASVTNLPVQSR